MTSPLRNRGTVCLVDAVKHAHHQPCECDGICCDGVSLMVVGVVASGQCLHVPQLILVAQPDQKREAPIPRCTSPLRHEAGPRWELTHPSGLYLRACELCEAALIVPAVPHRHADRQCARLGVVPATRRCRRWLPAARRALEWGNSEAWRRSPLLWACSKAVAVLLCWLRSAFLVPQQALFTRAFPSPQRLAPRCPGSGRRARPPGRPPHRG